MVPLIREVVLDAGYQKRDIGAISVSKGPGSYTGLRIGVSTAKGLAFGLAIPLVGVATFEALAWANRHIGSPRREAATREPGKDDVLVTTAPSRRNEAYWQLWRHDALVPVALTEPTSDTYDDVADALRRSNDFMTLAGDGAEILQAVLEKVGLSPVVLGVEELQPAIHGVSALGHRLIDLGQTEDVALFEPFYLKEFVALKGASPFDRLPF